MYESPELLQVMVKERQQELWHAMRAGHLVSGGTVGWLRRWLRRRPAGAARQPAADERLAA